MRKKIMKTVSRDYFRKFVDKLIKDVGIKANPIVGNKIAVMQYMLDGKVVAQAIYNSEKKTYQVTSEKETNQ